MMMVTDYFEKETVFSYNKQKQSKPGHVPPFLRCSSADGSSLDVSVNLSRRGM